MFFIRTSYNKSFRLVNLLNVKFNALTSRYAAFAFDHKEQIIQVDKYKINHTVVGDGDHNVLLLPGLLGTMQSDFGPLFTELDKEEYTLVSWDPIGYGKSRPPQREFTSDFYENDAKIVGKLMEKLERRPFSVVGLGDGAITAIILAALHPENLHRAVLIAPMSFVTKDDVHRCQGLSRKPKLTHDMENLYGAKYAKTVWTGYCKYYQDVFAHKKGEICRKLLPKVKCPTLVLHGELDPAVPLRHGKYVAKQITGAEIQVIKKGKHKFLYQFPDKTTSMIQEFLSMSTVKKSKKVKKVKVELPINKHEEVIKEKVKLPVEKEVIKEQVELPVEKEVIKEKVELPAETSDIEKNEELYHWEPPKHCRGKFKWHKYSPGQLPPGAVPVGRDTDGAPLYAGRGRFNDLLPGKVRQGRDMVFVPYNGLEERVEEFEVLESEDIAWQESEDGLVNDQAMVVGQTVDGEDLYMGRAFYENTITPGKVHPSHRCLYIPFHGQEITLYKDYEIMLLL